jgi:transposase InsO family protein
MPWQEVDTMMLRREFVELASQEGANVSELCRRHGISRKTGYKWLQRQGAGAGKLEALQDRSRRPEHCPHKTDSALEREVVKLRLRHPCWGGRKIAWRLAELGQARLTPSTVTRILHRHGLIEPEASARAAPLQRFEHERPNAMWQMDFKGTFETLAGACLPLTVLDDHSRFNLVLNANARTDTATVKPLLERAFERYGLPVRINTDNGPPWGAPSRRGRPDRADHLDDSTGHHRQPQPTRTSSDQRQDRALPPDPEEGSAQRQALRRSRPGAAQLRPLARHLQLRAPA